MNHALRTICLVLCLFCIAEAASGAELGVAMVEVKPGESIPDAMGSLPPAGGVCRLLKGIRRPRSSCWSPTSITPITSADSRWAGS